MEGLHQRIRRIERRLLGRAVLRSTVAVAMVLGAVALPAALAAPHLPRWLWVAGLVLGPPLGWLHARRTRPTSSELVLWIDHRLGAQQAIVTAWELGDDVSPLMRGTVRHAQELLAGADRRASLPSLGTAQLAWLVPAGLFVGLAWLVPVPALSRASEDRVVVASSEALRRIERLAEEVRDPARRRELDEAARRARELSRELTQGTDRQQARDALEALRRELESARRPPTAGERAARDAALEALASEPELQRALSERDPSAFDRAVERAAARREEADRQRARDALSAAAAAAARRGDSSLADSLLRREQLLARRAEQAALARELADALPELQGAELRRQLQRLERDGDGAELSRAMVDAMREAWSRLTPEERQRLADGLRRAQAAENREAQAQQREAARPLDADEIERRLRQALEDVDRLRLGLGQSGEGIPVPGGQGQGQGQGQGGQGQGGQGQGGQGQGGQGQGQGQGGQGQGQGQGGQGGQGQGGQGGQGGGPGSRDGETRPVSVPNGPLARVRPDLRPGAPSQTTFEWVNPDGTPLPDGMPEGQGTDGARQGEAGAIERSPIPEDYRDHVRTYFGGSGESTR